MKAKLSFKEKEVEIHRIKKCEGLGKFVGLMFKNRNANARLFEFTKPTRRAIHSLFCPDFLAIWLIQGKIVDYKLVTGNKLSIKPEEKFDKLLEIPVNKRHERVIKLFLENKKKHLNTPPSINR